MTYTAPILDTYAHEIVQAIEQNGFIALVGEYGAGKTHLVRSVKRRLDEQPVTFVDSLDLSDRTVTIASLLRDLIIALGETPKRSSSALSHQAIKVLGRHVKSHQRRVCLVVDDAHRLNHQTLSALKRLREKDFAGLSPLLSIVLLGHLDLADTLAKRQEIGWRCDTLRLDEDAGWMTPPERVRYLETVFAGTIAPETRERIAALCTLPEEMNQLVRTKLREARRLGLDVLDQRVLRPSLREMKDALGEEIASVRKIARAAGLSPKAVQQAITDGDTNPHTEAVRAAIEKMAAAQASTNGQAVAA